MSIDRLDWDTLRVFRAVAELSSMNAAAARLGESPPTISRKIDELEKTLKALVFERSPRGMELTETGQQVLQAANAMAEVTEALRSEIAPKPQNIIGSITLCTGDGLGPYWIAPRLYELQKDHPKLQIRMMVNDPAPDLHGEQPVIAIGFTETREPDVITHKLGVQHYAAFASDAYLKERGKPASLLEYHKHRCILHTAYVNQMESWAPRMAALRNMIDFAFVTNSGTAMVEACAQGGGIAILPSYMAKLDKNLVPLALPDLAPIKFWMTYTERVRRLPQGQLLIDWLRAMFATPEALWFTDEFTHPSDYDERYEKLTNPDKASDSPNAARRAISGRGGLV